MNKFKEALSLFLTFIKIGAFTFGGGYAMIAMFKEEVINRKNWIDEEEFMEIIAIAESTPGPIAVNMATYIGYKRLGVLGSIVGTLAIALPSLVIIYVISLFLNDFLANKYVAFAFEGIKMAVVFLILKAAYSFFKKAKKDWFTIITFVIITILMILIDIFSLSFSSIYFILIGGLLGFVIYGLKPKKEEEK